MRRSFLICIVAVLFGSAATAYATSHHARQVTASMRSAVSCNVGQGNLWSVEVLSRATGGTSLSAQLRAMRMAYHAGVRAVQRQTGTQHRRISCYYSSAPMKRRLTGKALRVIA